ncbi:MAG: zinc ABC transporter substrate-binding protein [Clostridia bacterium]|nr:zinc ABC transporter substrate-binding protein [Clostridia bacterium]
MLKRFPVLLLILLISLAGCTGPGNSPQGDTISVVTTIFPPYDFARVIGGESVTVTQLVRPGMECHTFDPSPADILAVQNCDLFLYIGGESEAWVDTILEAVPDSNRVVLRLMDSVECLEEEDREGMTIRETGEEKEEDEHIWTSPRNCQILCKAIEEALCRICPERETEYRNRLSDYLERLDELDGLLRSVTEQSIRKTLVFGDRFPFRYLCNDYSLSYWAAFPGCAAETEPSPATMAFLIEKIRAEQIPVVFSIEMSNQKVADAIAAETGAAVLTLHSCHNRTLDEAKADLSYLDLMNRNLDALRTALN